MSPKEIQGRIKNPLKFFVAAVHGWVVDLRNYLFDVGLFDSFHLPQKVVSVGNLTFGGTGKTPFVKYLVEYYQQKGLSVCVLMRGYRGRIKKPQRVTVEESKIRLALQEYGDEAVMLARTYPQVPIYVGPFKFETAYFLSGREKFDLLVVDDGFQHRSLGRDLNILLIDATAELNDFQLFPMGKARDRWASKSRADLIFLTKTNLCDELWLDHLRGLLTENLGDVPFSEARLILNGLDFEDSEKKAIAFAGIGNPQSFRQAIINESLVQLLGFMPFPDHHDYTAVDIENILKKKNELDADLVLTTTKDAVKLGHTLRDQNLRVLDSAFVLSMSDEDLEKSLLTCLNLGK